MIRDYVCVDLETTGVNVKWNKILEIGAVKVRDGQVVDEFSMLVNPGEAISPFIVNLTGITDEMVKDAEHIETVLPKFLEFAGDDVLLGHNLIFDFSFLKQNAINLNHEFEKSGVDTLRISRKLLSDLESRKLDYLCEYFGIEDNNHHRALNDAKVTVALYEILFEKYSEDNPELFQERNLQYKVKKMVPITDKQKKYLLALIEYHKLEIDYNIDDLTKNEASRKIDKILASKGRILY